MDCISHVSDFTKRLRSFLIPRPKRDEKTLVKLQGRFALLQLLLGFLARKAQSCVHLQDGGETAMPAFWVGGNLLRFLPVRSTACELLASSESCERVVSPVRIPSQFPAGLVFLLCPGLDYSALMTPGLS